ncbi:MAG: hypothetical protein HZA90_17950 [Verrucomicrobia bacterium]|nr:hypothetical protein [Verrucomicrobiota bacterium]
MAFTVAGAAVDESKLPPPAETKIEFARDIKPILDRCLRCHSGDRPKSNFRLTDRASALKGGENGVAILSGQSAKSPLIHFVAGLVEDMEMPPPDKGAPLTTNEISLLRAWIDQGVPWDEPSANNRAAPSLKVTPGLSWTTVRGNAAKFRELEWQPVGWNGGAEDFQLQQRLADGRAVVIEGRAWRDDYRLSLELRKPELGFTRFGFEQFRKYYDDSGGYSAAFSLGRDLHLDIGRAWAEAGLTLPHWPRLVVGYEYQFKDGDKSMLTWGPVLPPTGNPRGIRSLYPSAKHIDEDTHILRLDVSHDVAGYHLEDNLRTEFYRLTTSRTDALFVLPGQTKPAALLRVDEGQDHVQVANTLRLEKEVADWWFVSGGHLYSWLDGDASIRLSPQDGTGQPGAGSAWSGNRILLNEVSQVFNFNSQFRPAKPLTASVGVQAEWRRQEAFGDADFLEVLDPNDPSQNVSAPAVLRSQLDQTSVEENVLLRYTGLPLTALFAEARLKQDEFTQFKEQDGGPHDFLLGTEASTAWEEFRSGFSVSPWRRVSFTGQYKHRDHRTDYDHRRDEHPRGTPGPGYPGFIGDRRIATDELQARLTTHPATWLKTTLTYQWSTTQYRTTTDATSPADAFNDATPGGALTAGQYEAHALSAGVTLSPFRRVYLTTMLSYQRTRLTTADNGNRSVAPYRGDIYSAISSLSYVLDNRTDLVASYVFSRSGYGQSQQADGLPLGIDYTRHGVQVGIVRRFSQRVTARLQYGWFDYREPSSGSFRNYTAHQVLAALHVTWP